MTTQHTTKKRKSGEMTSKTPTQRLQECQDDRSMLKNRLEQMEGLAEELATVKEQLARAKLQLEADVSVSNSERQRYTEKIAQAVSERDAWTKRAVKVENSYRDLEAKHEELRAFVKDKECVLPRIRQILS